MLGRQSDWEVIARQLIQEVSAQFLTNTLHSIANGQPRHTGSDADHALAEQFCAQWRSWGIPKVHIQEFFVTIPLEPADGHWNQVELIDLTNGSVVHTAQNFVVTRAHISDRYSGDSTNAEDLLLPVYQAFSISGTATGPFVFVNYARAQDLQAFDRAQGRVPGQPSLLCSPDLIAIARLEQGTRQSKLRALLAHCTCGPGGLPVPGHHPAALVLYPDPQDCVSPAQVPYPHGPGLPGDAPVFGHVCMSTVGGGNPGTPHLPSIEHVYEEEGVMTPDSALTPIPVQPIGYDDASVFLNRLSGPSVPVQWSGCLAKRIGPSSGWALKVTVRNRVSPNRIRCVNALGVIPGDQAAGEADQYVILGNHRDTWVQGACDPGSGTVLLQQIAKVLGQAYTQGFRPRRTVILASWDGEELSLLGSTHFAEAFQTELRRRAVAYINLDCPIKGHTMFNARTDPILADALVRASRLVPVDPPVDMRTLFDEWLAQEPGKEEPTISPPGGGSDHIPFAYKLGIPSSYPEYVPENAMYTMPMYHTAYDTFTVVERFVDPPSKSAEPLPRHGLMARLLIAYLIHLACATRLPYSPNRLVADLLTGWDRLAQSAKRKIPNLSDCGVYLDWITDDLKRMADAANTFELLVSQWETQPERFPIQLNSILAGLPQQFVMHSPTIHQSPFGYVLLGPSGYRSAAFPQVQVSFDRFVKQPSGENLALLKRALSVLAACLHRATGWLDNGLLGLDSLPNVVAS